MLHAQTKQADVTRATLYGVGFSNLLDTYLSPQEYTGIDLRLSRESIRKSRWENMTQQTFFQSNLSFTHNQIENNNTIGMLANWNYALHYNFPITENFKLLAGGLADLNGGSPTTCAMETILCKHEYTPISEQRAWPCGIRK